MSQPLPLQNSYFLMRHGESLANQADLIVSDPETGCRAYGLSSLGRQQAEESARSSGLEADIEVICSDFLRTVETAEIAARVLGCKGVVKETLLRERHFGELNGSSGERYREVWQQDSLFDSHTTYGAESPRALAVRLRRALETLESRHSGRRILLVSHGDTLRFLQLVAADRPLTEHMKIALFRPAEIRPLEFMPPAEG